ncbi:hypothetical protein BT96DRAFT_1008052 [Gymnopus androsaceus JB14]|uniref:Uncharacterized protein n=1 Tax=Gymnopus androsaceus JB14 TaxID=1447944 RepID=A0A6A4GGI2_9AGAR|nr:hypothetical protein BT96DRAFT_1008052 [Gymnopus androsaceus JB14]
MCPEPSLTSLSSCMTSKNTPSSKKPLSSTALDQEARARRRSSSIPALPSSSTTFVPSQNALIENDLDYDIVEDRSTSPSLISETPTPATAVIPLPTSPTPSTTSSVSDDEMSPNPNGNNTIDMGGHKSGCLLLMPHPTLDTLEELWTYFLLNCSRRKLTDEDEIKKEFVACFMKFANLRDIVDGIGPKLYLLAWIELNPAYPNLPNEFLKRPFFDAIRNAILGCEWARIYDAKKDNYVMRATSQGFGDLAKLMEAHNKRLRGTQFHKSDAEIKLLILQKITPRFRDDLCDCQVEDSLPYDEWKEKCLVVEERRPPGPPAYANDSKRNDQGHGKKDDQQNQNVVLSSSTFSQGPADAYSFPKLGPSGPNTQCSRLMETETCFRCYNLYAGHQGGHCPTKGPPRLSVPYRPLTDAHVALAKTIHAKDPNKFIPYEFILKQNPAPQNSQRHVAAVRPREALTEMPDLSEPSSTPSSFAIQPHGVHAVYGSHPIVHSSSGAAVYGNALERGFDYESASRPVRRPVAALVPARRNAREYYDDEQDPGHNLVSPSNSRNVRRRGHDSRRSNSRRSGSRNRQRSRSQSSSRSTDSAEKDDEEEDDHRRGQDTSREEHLRSRLLERADSNKERVGDRQHARSYSVSTDSMPLVLPHLEWHAKINGPNGFAVENLLLDSACPFMLIHANLVASLGLKRHRMRHPQEMSLAMSSGSNDSCFDKRRPPPKILR